MFLRRLSWAFYTASRLACPRCGSRTVFHGLFSMHAQCAVCDLTFEREPGYFIGAIYINYAATVVLAVGGFFLLDAYTTLSLGSQLALWSVFCIVFPLLFFRYSKSIWLAIDHLFSPEDTPRPIVRRRRV